MGATNDDRGVLAVDVGSSRLKLGWFPSPVACLDKPEGQLPIAAPRLPEPAEAIAIAYGANLDGDAREAVRAWLEQNVLAAPATHLASVRPSVTDAVQEVLAELTWPAARQLTFEQLPLSINVDFPERVGIDRLLNAVGANRLRQPGRPAIVVDLGTAVTVDLISSDGTFQGGAILPGIAASAGALHGTTASLPELALDESDQMIEVVGKNTEAAIASGLFWGTVGAINELVARTAQQCDALPHLLVSGGGAASVCSHLKAPDGTAHMLPHLVLSSICVVAGESP